MLVVSDATPLNVLVRVGVVEVVQNLLHLPDAIARLIEIGFYIDPKVVRRVVQGDDLPRRMEGGQ